MEVILDFTKPVHVPTLDAVVAVYASPSDPQRQHAEAVLLQFRQHPEAWTRVDTILSESALAQTRYLALQILEDLIKFRWKSLAAPTREGVRTYLVQKIIGLSSKEEVLHAQRALIDKMNLLLVGILKHDWPASWPSFIPDLVGASRTSEVLCENNVTILRFLSEEVFDYSKDSMTAAKAEALKTSMKSELRQIFELLLFVLQASSRKSLVVATLGCLQRYVSWVPQEYIFQTQLLELLCMKYLPIPEYRVPTLEVLTEVAGIVNPEYNAVFEGMYVAAMGQVVRVVPPDASIKGAYATALAAGDDASMLFVRHLALFLTTFLSSHAALLERESYREALQSGLNYLVQISDVDDTEVFKIAVEFWLRLASSLYESETVYNPLHAALGMGMAGVPGAGMGMVPGIGGRPAVGGAGAASSSAAAAGFGGYPLGSAAAAVPGGIGGAAAAGGAGAGGSGRLPLYAEVLARVREVMIRHMAKPEEVLIEKDDSGEYVREAQKDTDAIALYKVMRDAMVFLTHLDPRNTEELMLEKLAKQVNNEEWGYDALNTLCWAIGSISGTMSEAEEKNFLVTVIKDLLLLCETKRGKANKAVIASNIMYVVGQYPRFLRAHWKFLKTVVFKLFEFMHERHPGVQDMAVDTMLKIAQKCKRRFVQVQHGESRAFIDELCGTLPAIISDLEPHQVTVFYEAAGHMVNAYADERSREVSTASLMDLPNKMWRRLMGLAGESIENLKHPDTLRELQRVLRTNVAACRSIGSSFASQIGTLFLDMMNVYRTLSSFLNAAVATSGPGVMAEHAAKCMRAVKKEILSLVATYVSVADSPAFVAEHFVPPLLEPVLGDYASAHPVAREPEVLTLMMEIVNKLRGDVLSEAPRILTAVFEPTLSMITAASASEFPEHRVAFFKLLESINRYCFQALFAISREHLKMVIDSVVWAFKHTSRETGEVGLAILLSLMENVAAPGLDVAQVFYETYLLQLITDLLIVLTDRLHKAHFKEQCDVLRHMFQLVDTGAVTTPLWTSPLAVSTGAGAAYVSTLTAAAGGVAPPPTAYSNQGFVREFVRMWVAANFKNLTPPQVSAFVEGLFVHSRDHKAYKSHVRDFLIDVLEIKGRDEGGDLFAEERVAAAAADDVRRRAVPGLQNPWDALPADYDATQLDDL